jgi:hypothetical protein
MLDWIYTNLGSISQIILYITIFYIIYFSIYFKQNKEHIINNWNEYRYKPYIMPIAGFIKKDDNLSATDTSIKNMSEVLWNILKKFFNVLIKPIQYILGIITKIIKDTNGAINKVRQQLKIMRNFLFSIVMKMMKRIENIVAATVFTFGKINDMTKRQLAIYQNLVYMMETFAVTLTAFISGTFGKLIDFTEVGIWTLPIFTLGLPGLAFPMMAMCFTPNTNILTKHGQKRISNIKIGDVLQDGSIVISTMKFVNKDPIYEYNNDYVSGTHFVNENGKWKRVCESSLAKKMEYCGYLYNLNTSNNNIITSNNLFLDYDEYSSRKLAEKENSEFLYKLNGDNVVWHHPKKTYSENVRYKIGLGETTLINGIKIENIVLGSKLSSERYVIGIVSHECSGTDTIFILNGVSMTEWVKVFYNNSWICVRDHPNAIMIRYIGKKLYSIVTNDHTIQLDNGIILRDFLEY